MSTGKTTKNDENDETLHNLQKCKKLQNYGNSEIFAIFTYIAKYSELFPAIPRLFEENNLKIL